MTAKIAILSISRRNKGKGEQSQKHILNAMAFQVVERAVQIPPPKNQNKAGEMLSGEMGCCTSRETR